MHQRFRSRRTEIFGDRSVALARTAEGAVAELHQLADLLRSPALHCLADGYGCALGEVRRAAGGGEELAARLRHLEQLGRDIAFVLDALRTRTEAEALDQPPDGHLATA